jgi:hypothetical protein
MGMKVYLVHKEIKQVKGICKQRTEETIRTWKGAGNRKLEKT